MWVNCPGMTMLITPAKEHIQVQVLLRAGMLLIITVELPGIHGAEVIGVQGMGVSTPSAAAVAAATAGFAILIHIAKGLMFIKGT